MENSKLVSVYLQSNINNYRLIIHDGDNSSCLIINSFNKYVSICAKNQIIEIMAIPLTKGYNKSLFFILDVNACKCGLNLNLDFILTPVEDVFYTFYLTDATYGLPIDGILHFNQT